MMTEQEQVRLIANEIDPEQRMMWLWRDCSDHWSVPCPHCQGTGHVAVIDKTNILDVEAVFFGWDIVLGGACGKGAEELMGALRMLAWLKHPALRVAGSIRIIASAIKASKENES